RRSMGRHEMTTFVESPWPAVGVCFVLLLAFGALFVHTGRVSIIVAMVAIMAGLVGMIVLERTIVTETEQVEDTLHGIAEHLAANNVPEILAAFAPNCPGIGQARSALNQVTIQSA